MKTIIDVVNDAILNVSINPLVESGMFDPNNDEHIFLLMENLEGRLEEEIITEAIQALRLEGKHPDRQAYNKEGWLVTFPSKQYRDSALKKGTHSLADPTHGKGGMNLYYKRRGKQKRMTQQQPSVAGTPDASQGAQPAVQPTVQTPAPQTAKQEVPPTDQAGELPSSDETPKPATQEPKAEPEQKPSEPAPTVGGSGGGVSSAPLQQKSSEPMGDVPSKQPEAPAEPNKVEVTEKFASSKGWESTPYGEWRNPQGETVAVVSLSGEVTPIKSNDREELKLFASKQS